MLILSLEFYHNITAFMDYFKGTCELLFKPEIRNVSKNALIPNFTNGLDGYHSHLESRMLNSSPNKDIVLNKLYKYQEYIYL